MTGDVEKAVLEMYLSGISVRKIAGVGDALTASCDDVAPGSIEV